MENCYCGNDINFDSCCKPIIDGFQPPITAEQLMRSRYSAYYTQAADYLVATTHESTRALHKKSDILGWSQSNKWMKLDIIKSLGNTVEFKAYFIDEHSKAQVHHEKSTFLFENGNWFYVDGIFFLKV